MHSLANPLTLFGPVGQLLTIAGIELGEDAMPDESSMLRFRHLLERFGLTERLFAEVRVLLDE
ncbi:MAG: transposase, partial [Gammaproteobacteria bacterium]